MIALGTRATVNGGSDRYSLHAVIALVAIDHQKGKFQVCPSKPQTYLHPMPL
jgi:hypothetical protein